jgi:hypothetical protein
MPRFRKTTTVEAVQWHRAGDDPRVRRTSYHEVSALFGGTAGCCREPAGHTWAVMGVIDSLEGKHAVCPGDWIITGVSGEAYACKPDVFAATYEPVETRQRPPHSIDDCTYPECAVCNAPPRQAKEPPTPTDEMLAEWVLYGFFGGTLSPAEFHERVQRGVYTVKMGVVLSVLQTARQQERARIAEPS